MPEPPLSSSDLKRRKIVSNQRFKVPSAILQYSRTLDKNITTLVFKFGAEVGKQALWRLPLPPSPQIRRKMLTKPLFDIYGLSDVVPPIEPRTAELIVFLCTRWEHLTLL